MNTTSRLYRARTLAIAYILLGAFLTSFGITVLDFAQGHITGNWSGIAPIGRLNDLPYRIAFAAGAVLLVSSLALFLRYPPIVERSKQIVFGALCGLVTIGSLLGPWISETDIFFLICSIGVIGISFCYRAAVARSAGERTKN
jgi:hypothetical protein